MSGPPQPGVAEHPVEKLAREFQDRVVGGLYEGVYALEGPELELLMECQARACVPAFTDLYQIPEELDLDGFLERMTAGGSSKIQIRREGRVIYWDELHGGQCVCPLVTRGVIPLAPGLCRCASHWLRMLFERHVRGPVRVELLGSAAAGGQNCSFRVELPPVAQPSE